MWRAGGREERGNSMGEGVDWDEEEEEVEIRDTVLMSQL